MIEKIKEKPFLLLLIPLVFFFTISFILTNESIDIQLHDTYFVIAQQQILITISLGFLLILGLYSLFQRFLWSKKLTWIHVITTSVLLLYIFFFSILFSSFEVPRRYYTYNEFENFYQYAIINNTISISAILLFFMQFLLLINIIIGIIKKSNKS